MKILFVKKKKKKTMTTKETLVAFHAMELCRDLGLLDIILEGDSAVVVKAVAATDTNRSRSGRMGRLWMI
jgi:ribonuclease HI